MVRRDRRGVRALANAASKASASARNWRAQPLPPARSFDASRAAPRRCKVEVPLNAFMERAMRTFLLSILFLLAGAGAVQADPIYLYPGQSVQLGSNTVFCAGDGGPGRRCEITADCGDAIHWRCEFGYCRELRHACAGTNQYGTYEEGGGCNQYGCWARGGGCNQYGCYEPGGGGCNQYGCWLGGGHCDQYGCAAQSSGQAFHCDNG
jgi:hypothetical protein